MKKVIILLSTYNGQNYIEEQIESLLKQTYNNIEIFIRDDGSKDNTITILKKYEKKYNYINVEYGNNIGFYKSFLWLLNNAPKADYYSFCDQDDVWKNDKIQKAVTKLNKYDNKKPNLYFTDYEICDSNLNFISYSKKYGNPYSLERALLAVQIPLGFNTVINYTLKNHIDNYFKSNYKIWGHDYWCYLIALCFGNVIYDEGYYSTKYRRHDANVSTYSKGFLKKQILRIKNFIFGNGQNIINDTVNLFYDVYKNDLSQKNREIIIIYKNKKFNIINRIKKLIHLKRYSDSLFDEFAIRVMLFLGKI
ncbi:MAG: glycosyltransferase [Bacilli bacterium]|nr:glycosyltransferase [Bacilli bacterium]